MLGYWQRPDEEALVYRGEWFCGGDLASIDADGYVWHHGRNDDIMNAMGYRVSPVEVETALAEHPAIAEIAVTEAKVRRSEEHTSELQSLMRISYAVFCLKKKKNQHKSAT